jgi:hypothetical protein
MRQIDSLSFVLSLVVLLVPEILDAETGSPQLPDAQNQKWGKAIEGQAISIATSKTVYTSGEPIILKINFKNTGHNEVLFVRRLPLAVYDVTVLMPDGTKAPLTLFGTRRFGSRSGGSKIIDSLKPGEQVRSEIELNRVFDMTIDGKYLVSVQRRVWKDGSLQDALKTTSNQLDVSIDNSNKR